MWSNPYPKGTLAYEWAEMERAFRELRLEFEIVMVEFAKWIERKLSK